jgi:hypothetical protein
VEQLWLLSLPNQDHNVGIEMPILALDFITFRRPTPPHAVAKRSQLRHRRLAC